MHLSVNQLDDVVVIWTGDAAVSEDISQNILWLTYNIFKALHIHPAVATTTVAEEVDSKAILFEIFHEGGMLEASITGSNGNVVLGAESVKNS